MKVLSLFDGISCARVALDRAGLKTDAYFTSEIDPRAIAISDKNWPDNKKLGDVRSVRVENGGVVWEGGGFTFSTKIDLLIGGSPCQDLSRANVNGKGLDGARSGLFYEYLRLLRELKPRWFVLENVASMKQTDRDVITRELGVEPIMIDAALVSAQSRRRYFWTNIPGVTLPADRGILLRDILEDGYAMSEKARTLTVSYGKNQPSASRIGTKYEKTMVALKPQRLGKLEGTKGGAAERVYGVDGKSVTLKSQAGGGGAKTGLYWKLPGGKLAVREATKRGYAIAEEGDSVDVAFPRSSTRRGRVGKKAKNLTTNADQICVFTRGEVRPLTPIECERLQSLPDGYTDAGVSKTARVMALGNAFNVEVVAHILRHIPKP